MRNEEPQSTRIGNSVTEPLGKVTCALTCFNAEDTIARAVKSALSQDWSDLEVLVIDDCSSDGSFQILSELTDQNPLLRSLQNPVNLGPGGTRQRLLEEATGDFVVFFDDDDESDPDRVKQQVARIIDVEAQHSDKPVLCYASGERRYPNGYVLPLDAIGSRGNPVAGRALVDFLLLNRREDDVFYGAGTPTCALAARRQTLLDAGGFDPRFRRVEDADLAIRHGLAGGVFTGTPAPLFRQYATTGADKSARKNARAELQLVRKHAGHLRQTGDYRYASSWVLLRYYHFRGERGGMARAFLRCLRERPARAIRHIITSGTRRFFHERRMAS